MIENLNNIISYTLEKKCFQINSANSDEEIVNLQKFLSDEEDDIVIGQTLDILGSINLWKFISDYHKKTSTIICYLKQQFFLLTLII